MTNKIANKLFDTIPSCMRALRTEVKIAAKSSLTLSQYRVLSNISRGLTHVGEIAELHGVSQPSMSRLIDGLVERKLIQRKPSKTDRRAIDLALTAKGRTLFKMIKTKASIQISKQMNQLSKEELNEINSSLNCLYKHFGHFLKVDDQ